MLMGIDMEPVTGAAALALLGKAVEVIGKLKESSDDATVDENTIKLHGLIISLQSEILRFQSEYGDLLKIKNDLEQQLVDKGQWSDIASKYELIDIGGRNFVYMLKADYLDAEPEHYICPICYEENIKFVLHCIVDNEYVTKYHCQKCDSKWSYQKGHPSVIQTRTHY